MEEDTLFEITTKILLGESLTFEEKRIMHQRNTKYELVKFLYLEKVKEENPNLTDFRFSPGNNFMNTPIIDIVNELLKINTAIQNQDYELVSDAPITGMNKRRLL